MPYLCSFTISKRNMGFAHWVVFSICITTIFSRSSRRPAKDWCSDRNGRLRAFNEEWRERETHTKCTCEYPESRLYFWDGSNPSDAAPFCQLEGCLDPSGRLLGDEDTFHNRGHYCICRKGTDPYLADAVTLFHTECSLELPDTRERHHQPVDHVIP